MLDFFKSCFAYYFSCLGCSIYVCHDEVKDKDFELELSWVGQGKKKINQNV